MNSKKEVAEKVRLSKLIDSAVAGLMGQTYRLKLKEICAVIAKIDSSTLSKIRKAHQRPDYLNVGLDTIWSAKNQIWDRFQITGDEPDALVINYDTDLHKNQVEDELLYFIQFYCNADLENDKALLTISKSKRVAELSIFHEKTGNGVRQKKHTYLGKVNDDINTDEEKFGITFTSRKREGDNFAIKILSTSCFNGDIRNESQVFYTGVYASSMNTSCGTIIIERTDKDTWESNLNSNDYPPSVYWHVFNSRVSVREESKSFVENLFRRIVDESEKLKSLYDAFTSQGQNHKGLLKQDLKDILIDTFGTLSGSLMKHTNEQGIVLLSGLLKDTTSAQNTRLFPPKQGKHYPETFTIWNEAIRENVNNNGLHFKELVSRDFWESELKEFHASLSDNPRYTLILVDFPPNLESILNFIIMEYKDGRKEVWFGWTFTKFEGKEQQCFQSDDASLVRFFELWYRDLSIANAKIT